MNKNKSFQQNQTYTVTAIEDASGWQEFFYGKMGEVAKNTHTFALPYETQTYPFAMEFEYDSRKNCASQMKRRHNFFSATHFATPLPPSTCYLPPVTWTHTFSAKEKDTETGLSYFGSRYYSSDLSIWLSVDPMSDKYPSLSPYVYCANNPIKLVGPNGEEIDPESMPLWNKMKSLIDFEKKLAKAYMNLEKKTGGLLFAGATKKYFCLDKTQKSMEMMEESSQMYKLAECSGDVSSVSFNNKNNSLTVNFSNVAGFIHEITHCKQFEQGDIGFHRKRGTAFVDVYDELEAYHNQASYDPTSLPHNVYEPLSVDWLRNIYDGKEFPYRSNGLISIGENSTASDLNRAFPGTYFNFKGTVSSKYRRKLHFKK